MRKFTDLPSDPWRWSAVDTVAALREKEISSKELIDVAIKRIEAVDEKVNALPIRCFERAYEQAKVIEKTTPPDTKNWLAGLPVAIKDYNDVGGVRTTYGSPIFSDNVPAKSDATVARLEKNGAIPIAKSNVPEWAGGHTFNPVNGLTRNPWNLDRSVGGSSGGSAAALATGQVWLATGNDLGGSLRTPASLNGIVGLRPGPGIVPRGSRLQAFDSLWVEGPMARSVTDIALMLDAGSGHDVDDPLSFNSNTSFSDAAVKPCAPMRVAFSPNLGVVPVASEICEITTDAVKKISKSGVDVTEEIPNFDGVLDAFQTLRATLFGTMMHDILAFHRKDISEDIIGNIERGYAVTPQMLFDAEQRRWKLYHEMNTFFETHDLLICPAASIAAFPVEQTYIREIDGTPCKTYIDWFAITFALTMTSCPVLSIPCGFTKEGLPVGVQVVGKPRGEAALLRMGRWIEKLFAVHQKVPIDPRAS